MSNVDEIIAMGWRGQAKGSRSALEERYTALGASINEWVPRLNQERYRLSTAPINALTSQRRTEYAFASSRLDKAIDAHRRIEQELNRRGGRNGR